VGRKRKGFGTGKKKRRKGGREAGRQKFCLERPFAVERITGYCGKTMIGRGSEKGGRGAKRKKKACRPIFDCCHALRQPVYAVILAGQKAGKKGGKKFLSREKKREAAPNPL